MAYKDLEYENEYIKPNIVPCKRLPLNIQLFTESYKTTTFSESNISVANNSSSLTINISFSSASSGTYFSSATLYCSCNGSTQSATVSMSKGGSASHSFTFNSIGHNSDGSKSVSWSWSCATGTSIGTVSDSGTKTLTKIARQATISSAPNFNDEGNPAISYSNPAGNSVSSLQACIANSSGNVIYAAYRDISKTGSSYTFNLTTAERDTLRAATPNSNSLSVRFYVKTVISGTTYYSYAGKTMTITNGNPTFDNFEYEDTNATTLALTGDDQVVVKNYSTIEATVSTLNMAEAIKSATMTNYTFSSGNSTATASYSSSEAVTMTIANAPTNILSVYATDSRGNSTQVTKTATGVDYTPLTKNTISVTRDNGVSETVTLQLSGTVNLVDFGSVVNSIQSSQYRYRVSGSENWSNWNSIALTVDANGNYSFNDEIEGDTQTLGFDINDTYEIQVMITDRLSSITFEDRLNSGVPNIALHKDGVGIMGKYDESEGTPLQIKGIPLLVED